MNVIVTAKPTGVYGVDVSDAWTEAQWFKDAASAAVFAVDLADLFTIESIHVRPVAGDPTEVPALVAEVVAALTDGKPCICGHALTDHQTGEGAWSGFCFGSMKGDSMNECDCESPQLGIES